MKVSVVRPLPGAARVLAGENVTVMPVGKPLRESAIEALKVELGVVVMVKVLEFPAATLSEVADSDRVNVGAGSIVSASAVCCFRDPLVAVTVIIALPTLAVLAAVSLSTLLPEPGAESFAGVNE